MDHKSITTVPCETKMKKLFYPLYGEIVVRCDKPIGGRTPLGHIFDTIVSGSVAFLTRTRTVEAMNV